MKRGEVGKENGGDDGDGGAGGGRKSTQYVYP